MYDKQQYDVHRLLVLLPSNNAAQQNTSAETRNVRAKIVIVHRHPSSCSNIPDSVIPQKYLQVG